MPNIKVSDSVYERLKTEAEGNFRTIGGQIEFLMANQRTHPVPARDKIEAENTPLPKNTEVETFEPAINDLIKRTKRNVLAEIAQIDNELKSTVNQDPDYWADMQERKQLLWDEYNGMEDYQ